jgi:superfamily II DNA or RNA helicase
MRCPRYPTCPGKVDRLYAFEPRFGSEFVGHACSTCGHRVTEADMRAEEHRLETEHQESLERDARIRGYRIGYCINRWMECDHPADDPWPSLEALKIALDAASSVELGRIKQLLASRETPQEREERKALEVVAIRQKEEDRRRAAEHAAKRAAEKAAREAEHLEQVARAEAQLQEAIARWNRFLETAHRDLPARLQWHSVSEEGEQFGELMNVGQLINLALTISKHPRCRWRLVPSVHPLEFVDRFCVHRPGTLDAPRLCRTTGIRESDRKLPTTNSGRDAPWHHQAFRKWQLDEQQSLQATSPRPCNEPVPAQRPESPARPSASSTNTKWRLGFCSDVNEAAEFEWEEEFGPNTARTVAARLSVMFPQLIFALQPASNAESAEPTLVRAGHVVTVVGPWNGAASVTRASHAIELRAHLDEAWVQREITSIDLNDLQVRDDALADDGAYLSEPEPPSADSGHQVDERTEKDESSSLGGAPIERSSPQDPAPSATQPPSNTSANQSSPELYPWQCEALTTWASHDFRGIAEAVTGAGKTRLAIEALRRVLDADGMGLVLVPTKELMFQWQRELTNAFPGRGIHLLYEDSKGRLARETILVATIQSALAHLRDESVTTSPSLIIADEVHRYGSQKWRRALLPAFEWRLGITATLERPDDGVRTAIGPYFERRIIHVDHQRARVEGAIAPYSIAFVGCRFLPSEQRRFDQAQDQMSKVQPILANELGLDPRKDFGKFMLGVQRLSKKTNLDFRLQRMARRWLNNFARRRSILAEASQKLDLLRTLAPCVHEAAGTIIFAETKSATQTAADVLSEFGIKTNVLHSDLASDERKQSLQEFEDDEVEVIAAPKLLDEGINVPEADLAIVVANSRSKRQLIQRAGRVLRNKADGRQARIVVLYVEGSSEDPTSGTRQDFMDVITPAATSHAVFLPGSSPADVTQFVNTLFPSQLSDARDS